MRMIQGGKFEHGFLSGFVFSLGGTAMMKYGANMGIGAKVAVGAALSGTAEALGGGKFANGAVTGAYVMMFNHLMEQYKSQKVSELDYPPAVDLRDENWDEQLTVWIKFIKENDLRNIPITKIINFHSVRLAGRLKYGNRYYGSKKVTSGYVEWSTPGADPIVERR